MTIDLSAVASPPRPDEPQTPKRIRRAAAALTSNWVFLALVVFIAFFSIKVGGQFFDVTNFRNIVFNASGTMLLAGGACYLIIGGQLDLSIGSVLVFSEVIAAKAIVAMSGPAASGYPNAVGAIAVGFVVAIGVGAAWGLLNGVLVTKLKIPSFIVTLGTLGMALGLAQVITHGADVTGLPTQMVDDIGLKQLLGLPVPVWIAALTALVAGVVLAKTAFGRYTYAVGSNSEAARRSGIKVTRHVIVLFTIMGALAGLAGLLDIARYTTTTISGHSSDNLWCRRARHPRQAILRAHPAHPVPPHPPSTTTIAFIPGCTCDPYYTTETAGFEAAAKAAGVTPLVQGAADFKASEQIPVLGELAIENCIKYLNGDHGISASQPFAPVVITKANLATSQTLIYQS